MGSKRQDPPAEARCIINYMVDDEVSDTDTVGAVRSRCVSTAVGEEGDVRGGRSGHEGVRMQRVVFENRDEEGVMARMLPVSRK